MREESSSEMMLGSLIWALVILVCIGICWWFFR